MATATRNRQARAGEGKIKGIRFPAEIEKALLDAAERNYRSLSAEVRARVDRTLKEDGYLEGEE